MTSKVLPSVPLTNSLLMKLGMEVSVWVVNGKGCASIPMIAVI